MDTSGASRATKKVFLSEPEFAEDNGEGEPGLRLNGQKTLSL
jgi:hypothetical protein